MDALGCLAVQPKQRGADGMLDSDADQSSRSGLHHGARKGRPGGAERRGDWLGKNGAAAGFYSSYATCSSRTCHTEVASIRLMSGHRWHAHMRDELRSIAVSSTVSACEGEGAGSRSCERRSYLGEEDPESAKSGAYVCAASAAWVVRFRTTSESTHIMAGQSAINSALYPATQANSTLFSVMSS